MSRITIEDVKKVAKLARLDLEDEKIETFAGQLEKILGYVAQLERINTELKLIGFFNLNTLRDKCSFQIYL